MDLSKRGLMNSTRVMGTYAYHLPISQSGKLSFGISAGVRREHIDVQDITAEIIDWGGFNHSIEPKYFQPLYDKMIAYLETQDEVWVRDAFACAEGTSQISLRLYTELPWSTLFANNMFIRPTENELENFEPEWQIIHAPNFKANPAIDGTAAENFSIISFSNKDTIKYNYLYINFLSFKNMKTNKSRSKQITKIYSSSKSRRNKDRFVNLMVFTVVLFITVMMIAKIV